jgi:predicted DNA-binding transcriptional regulator YafY
MTDTAARLLSLLSLLQARRDWTGPALADRLGVTTRTIRNDVERLRDLGYPVDATSGPAGGYRLGAGARLPPLLLDDDEAVAVALGLRTAAGISGIEETSVRALTKLEQVLPSRLRHRVHALHTATVPVPGHGPTVDAGVLTTLAATCRDHDVLRFDYDRHDGTGTVRRVEPHRLASARGRWYLVAYDLDRDDWRTFRVDRLNPRIPTGPRFTPREPPADLPGYVAAGLGTATWRVRATVRVHATAEELAARLPPGIELTADGDTCLAGVGSDTPAMLAAYLGMIGADFDLVDGPDELRTELHRLAERYRNAVS